MSPNVAMGRWPLRSAALKDPPSAQLLNRGAVVDDPVAPQRPQRRSLRSPELQRRPPNRNITKKEAGAPPPARALAAGADVQRPGSCEQLDRPTARAPSIGPQRKSLNRKIGGSRRSSSADFCENEMVAAADHARC